MSTYWFRPKRYGYGATPATWQGWIVTLAVVSVVVVSSILAPRFGAAHPSWLFVLVPLDLVVIGAFLIVSRAKTDGDWRWRWGGR